MPLCSCGTKFPNVVRVNGIRRNLSSRKKCLTCKPFRYGTVEYLTPRTFSSACVLCLKVGSHRLCRACRTKVRRHRAKVAATLLLGGKCSRCGWCENLAGLQFHHLSDKEFDISSAAHKSWSIVKREVLKCILLCANCHCVEHSDRASADFLIEVDNYKGDFYT